MENIWSDKMNDNQTSIQEIKDKIAMFDEERNWIEAYNPKDLSMSIAIEAARTYGNISMDVCGRSKGYRGLRRVYTPKRRVIRCNNLLLVTCKSARY